ncbi:MAG: rod shape-determining protein MreD [Rhodospirillales bacterium]
MKATFWQRLDLWARHLTPFGLTLTFVILSVVPMHVPGFARVAPLLALMAVYHWSVFYPRLLPVYAVFVIGILQDCLAGTALGVNALVLLVAFGIVLSQRRYLIGKSFFIVWLGFAIVAALAMAAGWALISVFSVTFVDGQALVFQYLVTLGLYPVICWFFLRWQQAFLSTE